MVNVGVTFAFDAGVVMAKPKFASLNASMVRRGITTRRVRMIGPDGEFYWTNQVIEVDVEDRRCEQCGSPLN